MLRQCLLAVLVAMILTGGFASPFIVGKAAAQAGHGDETAHESTTSEGDHKPPANNPFRGNIDLTIWSIAVFLVLFTVLRKFAWKPIQESLDKREKAIRSALEEAKKAQEEAQRLREQFNKDIQAANERARAIIDEARRDAQKAGDELRNKALADIRAEKDRSRHEIELARDSALQELWSQTVELAALVSSRAIGREMKPDDHRQLVEEAIAELRQAGSQRQREVASV